MPSALLPVVPALRLGRPELRALEPVGRLVPWVPRLLSIHLGVALLALGPVLGIVSGPMALLECANLAAVAASLVVLPPGAVQAV